MADLSDITRLDLTPEEHKLIMNHRRLRDKVAHLNKVTKIAKRLDPDAWRDPDAYRSSKLKTRRDAALAAAEKEIANPTTEFIAELRKDYCGAGCNPSICVCSLAEEAADLIEQLSAE